MAVIQKVPYNVIIWLMDLESLQCGSFLSAKDGEEIKSKFDIASFVLKMKYCLSLSLFPRFQLRYYLSLQPISVYLSVMFSASMFLCLPSVLVFPSKTFFSYRKVLRKKSYCENLQLSWQHVHWNCEMDRNKKRRNLACHHLYVSLHTQLKWLLSYSLSTGRFFLNCKLYIPSNGSMNYEAVVAYYKVHYQAN